VRCGALAGAPGAIGKRIELLGRHLGENLAIETRDELPGTICHPHQALQSPLGLATLQADGPPRVPTPPPEASPGDGESYIERAQALAVVCSEFSEGFGRMFTRDRVDSGALTLYVVRQLGLTELLRLTTGMFLGRWREDDALRIERVREVRLDTGKPVLAVMLDGEPATLKTPLVFRIHPLALTVLMPPVEIDPAAQATGEIGTGESAL
jgi:hypothetical protein